MSCGQPHETDCSDVLDQLYVYIDGELDHDTIGKIRQHLDECGPCLAEYDLDASVKALVSRACQDRAPDGLRARILARIDAIRVTVE